MPFSVNVSFSSQFHAFLSKIGATYIFRKGLSVAADANYTGQSFTNPENTLTADSVVLVNAQLNLQRGPLSAGLFVRNLFDRTYAATRLRTKGSVFAKSGEPLTIGAFVEYTF